MMNRDTGRAIMLTRGNNTHSGNLALRDADDRDVFHITASGSQVGALIPSDIVPVRFSRVSWGDGRASTESTIHRRILALPGVEHGHAGEHRAAHLVRARQREFGRHQRAIKDASRQHQHRVEKRAIHGSAGLPAADGQKHVRHRASALPARAVRCATAARGAPAGA